VQANDGSDATKQATARCRCICFEDLKAEQRYTGQRYAGLSVVNPFAKTA